MNAALGFLSGYAAGAGLMYVIMRRNIHRAVDQAQEKIRDDLSRMAPAGRAGNCPVCGRPRVSTDYTTAREGTQ